MSEAKGPVILFDGVCNLCSGAVQFIIKRDPNAIFKFAALQSETGQDLLFKYNLPREDFKTLILIDCAVAYSKSTAALHIVKRLEGNWKWLYALILIPRTCRDFIYKLIAKNRYKLFGRRDNCWISNKDLQNRFLG